MGVTATLPEFSERTLLTLKAVFHERKESLSVPLNYTVLIK